MSTARAATAGMGVYRVNILSQLDTVGLLEKNARIALSVALILT